MQKSTLCKLNSQTIYEKKCHKSENLCQYYYDNLDLQNRKYVSNVLVVMAMIVIYVT
jgi:hypothetical protein